MKLVVGLGNPGEKYKNTRHSVGFEVVDELAPHLVGCRVKFLKPQEYMNKSGVAVKAALKKQPKLDFNDLYVVHDDLDISLGEYKISFGKGPKVHNGLKSIYEQVGSKDFWHVRMGIDNRLKIAFKGSGEDYVLAKFLPEEREVVDKVISEVVKELKDVLG